jgi:hypothetical protein
MPRGHCICGTRRQGGQQSRQQGGQGNRQEAGQSRLEVDQGIQQREVHVSTLNFVPNAFDIDASSRFNPHMDVQADMFVVMKTCNNDQAKRIPFLWQR